MQMSQEFTKMMLGEDYEITEEMGDIEALQGVSQFPARIKCSFALLHLENDLLPLQSS
jgi:NifU-like protein involved in Fe-S cluster formation